MLALKKNRYDPKERASSINSVLKRNKSCKNRVMVEPNTHTVIPTWLFLPWFGQIGDAGVGAHEDVAGVQPPLQVQLLDLGQVYAAQRSLGEGVGRDQSQAEHAHSVDTVYGLRGKRRHRGQSEDGAIFLLIGSYSGQGRGAVKNVV